MFDPRECRIRNLWGLTVVLAASMLGAGCGTSQQLVGITIEPATETFGSASTPVQDDAGLNVQLRASGNLCPSASDQGHNQPGYLELEYAADGNRQFYRLDNSHRRGLRLYSCVGDHHEK